MFSDGTDDRRHFGRVHLDTPLPARLGDAKVSIVDLALIGARVLSEARFNPSASLELKFEWEGKPVALAGSVVRCKLNAFAQKPGAKSVYETALRLQDPPPNARQVLREMIGTYVVRALEQQKENARGVPPMGPFVTVDGKSDRYRKCELVEGKWRRTETNQSVQPIEGFTISADVSLRYCDMLCEVYQRSDEEGRRLTKVLAQLSVNKAEGGPTRRYFP